VSNPKVSIASQPGLCGLLLMAQGMRPAGAFRG
jgi:hypothetical protein